MPLNSCGGLLKILIKKNMRTEKNNGQTKPEHWTKMEIRIAIQGWFLVRVEITAL